jgi:prolipoprotein diacylglyceryltransferase
VQLFSSAVMFGVFALLWRRSLARTPVGEASAIFLVSYGALRLAIAPFRQEALLSMKAFSIVFIAVGAIGLWLARRERPMRIAAGAAQAARS